MAARCSRSLGYTGVRRWPGNRIRKLSLLFDMLFRAVDLGLVEAMVGKVESGTC